MKGPRAVYAVWNEEAGRLAGPYEEVLSSLDCTQTAAEPCQLFTPWLNVRATSVHTHATPAYHPPQLNKAAYFSIDLHSHLQCLTALEKKLARLRPYCRP